MPSIPIPLHLPRMHERLAGRLAEFSSAAASGRVTIALQLGGEPLFLHYDGPGTLRTIDRTRLPQVSAGCFAKPLTASLLSQSVSAGRVQWTSHINDLLQLRGAAARKLAGISLSHLLNHTHGLDASLMETVPRTPSGFIDAATLCERLDSIRLGEPGQLYSYGNAGAWLAGAALEHLTGTPYSGLLSASLFSCFREDAQPSPPELMCPATGGPLALTAGQWLSLAATHADSAPLSPAPQARALATLRSSQTPLPGWSPSEQAACLGWKYYGEGWFGHTSNTVTSSAFLRFNPGERTAIVMSATHDIALFAFSCLFRDYLPELRNLKLPRRLTPTDSESIQSNAYVGVYEQAKTKIHVARTEDGRLSFSVGSDDPCACLPPQTLHPAQHDIFFSDGKRAPEFPFIQFLRFSDHDGSFSHAWNGKQLWRRRQRPRPGHDR